MITKEMIEAARAASGNGNTDADLERIITAALAAMPVPATEEHSDDIAVDLFAAAMKSKLSEKRAQGYGGWDDPSDCTVEWLSELLRKHVEKGDPVDVGNFAMMIHQRSGRICK